MKKILILFFYFIALQNAFSQNCSNTSTGFVPINDLGKNLFRNYQGGLYPGGMNERPYSHNADGIDLAKQIVPLDTAGNYDPVNGRIVLLSIGMSNTSQEFQRFINIVNGAAYLNPRLSIVNGAQGGQTIDIILNPNAAFWTNIITNLSSRGLSAKQVQAVWFKEAQAGPTDTSFPGYPSGLKDKFKSVMSVMKSKYSNLKLCYNSSRIYAGYATSGLNPEPYAYYSGWSVKWTIEDQIYGDTTLTYKGSNPKSPWLSWGSYLWADGIIPRSDGLVWICPADYNSDGTHPSATGTIKVADMLRNFFMNDETTKPWFIKNISINITMAEEGFYNPISNSLNMKDTVKAYLHSAVSPYAKMDSSISVIDSVTFTGVFKFYNAVSGLYYIELNHRNSVETWSKSGGESLSPGFLYNYDFTSAGNMAYGNNMILRADRYCIYSGDITKDGLIDGSDGVLIDNDAVNFITGYINSDLTGDGLADGSDAALAGNNAANFIVAVVP